MLPSDQNSCNDTQVATRIGICDLIGRLLGDTGSVAIKAYDGSRIGPLQAATTIEIRDPTALRRLIAMPGELSFCRAYVEGEIVVEGDLSAVLSLGEQLRRHKIGPADLRSFISLARAVGLGRTRPPEAELTLCGRRHSQRRDRAAIISHYDVSNAFYRMILGPSMTYSCALWATADAGLEEAQAAKHDIICHKLELRPGMRLLDIGCGWGSCLIYAARHYGVRGIGVTISAAQAELAARRVAEAGVADLVTVRLQDYRDITDERFDAISSIGMLEHVGKAQLLRYFTACARLVRPRGKILIQTVLRAPNPSAGVTPRIVAQFLRGRPLSALAVALQPRRTRVPEVGGFIDRYVFPDSELHDVGTVTSVAQRAGLEIYQVETMGSHYALTLRNWVSNLQAAWPDAVKEIGLTRARVWHLYMAGTAHNFELGHLQVGQFLAARPVTVHSSAGRRRFGPLLPL